MATDLTVRISHVAVLPADTRRSASGRARPHYVGDMSQITGRRRRLVTSLALIPLALTGAVACSSGDDETHGPSPEAVTRINDVVLAAATAAGEAPNAGGAGGGGEASALSLGGFTRGATHGAYTACTGGGTIAMNLAGTDVVLDCDGQAHRVESLVLDDDTATLSVTRPSDGPSEWAVLITGQ